MMERSSGKENAAQPQKSRLQGVLPVVR